MLENGKSLDQFSVERFVGRGVCVDVRQGFDSLQLFDVRQGDIVLLFTGMGAKYYDESYFHNYPGIPPEIAEFLVNKKVSMVGSDTCNPDTGDDFPIHRTLLGGDVLIIENLTNLDKLVGKECVIYALPIYLGLDAAPARVIAQLQR
jgi:kynurenine formamidase